MNYLLYGILLEKVIRKQRSRGQKSYIASGFTAMQPTETHGLWTVLQNGTEYTKVIREDQGSKQGGIKSTMDYKAYNKNIILNLILKLQKVSL